MASSGGRISFDTESPSFRVEDDKSRSNSFQTLSPYVKYKGRGRSSRGGNSNNNSRSNSFETANPYIKDEEGGNNKSDSRSSSFETLTPYYVKYKGRGRLSRGGYSNNNSRSNSFEIATPYVKDEEGGNNNNNSRSNSFESVNPYYVDDEKGDNRGINNSRSNSFESVNPYYIEDEEGGTNNISSRSNSFKTDGKVPILGNGDRHERTTTNNRSKLRYASALLLMVACLAGAAVVFHSHKEGGGSSSTVSSGIQDVCEDANPCKYGSECITHTATTDDDDPDVSASASGDYECECLDYLSTGKHCEEVNACVSGQLVDEKEITSHTDPIDSVGLRPFASSMAALPDFSGDGTGDVVVGGFYEDNGSGKRGSVKILGTRADGPPFEKTLVSPVQGGEATSTSSSVIDAKDDPEFDAFGWAVAGLQGKFGDAKSMKNGIIVGAPQDKDGGNAGDELGAVHLILLTNSGKVSHEKKISATQGWENSPLGVKDRFGSAVVTLGEVDNQFCVGAPGDRESRGAVYVLFLSKKEMIVTSSSKIDSNAIGELAQGDQFGSSLAALGANYLAVGAPGAEEGRGAVYIVFLTKKGEITRHTKLRPAGAETGGLFGTSLAVLGDLNHDGVADIAVGAPHAHGEGTALSGSVYVLLLEENLDGIKAEQEINGNQGGLERDIPEGGRFGSSLAVRAEVGGDDGDGLVEIMVGSLHYLVDSTEIPTRHSTMSLKVPPGFVMECEDDHFCVSSKGTAVCKPCPAEGQRRSLNDYSECEDINECDEPSPCPHGGSCVNKEPYYRCEDNPCDTMIHGETKIGTGGAGGFDFPNQQGKIYFGKPASIGDLDKNGVADLAVAARYGNRKGSTHTGALFIIFRSEDGSVLRQQEIAPGLLDTTSKPYKPSPNHPPVGGMASHVPDGTSFARGTALLGDLDGDGTTEILVASTAVFDYTRYTLVSPGCLYLLSLNHMTGLVESEKKIVEDPIIGWTSSYGWSVANLGNVDGDEDTVDIAVGSPLYDTSSATGGTTEDDGRDHGAVYIFFLNRDTWTPQVTPIRLATNEKGLGHIERLSQFGDSIASLGDLDGDGVADMAVGAPHYPMGEGRALILFLTSDGHVKQHVEIMGNLAPDRSYEVFGSSLSAIGDVDGDGTVDLIVGAKGKYQPAGKQGVAVVVLLNAEGSVKGHRAIGEGLAGFQTGVTENSGFGTSGVAGLGDLDGNGIVELAIGNEYDDNYVGAVFTLGIGRNFAVPPTCDTDGGEVCTPLSGGPDGTYTCTATGGN